MLNWSLLRVVVWWRYFDQSILSLSPSLDEGVVVWVVQPAAITDWPEKD